MLFAPIMELRSERIKESSLTLKETGCISSFGFRTNEERTYYTGALCGLGWNSHTKEAILPEQDIELAFDVKVDVEDVSEVRKRRVFVVLGVCGGVSVTFLRKFPSIFGLCFKFR